MVVVMVPLGTHTQLGCSAVAQSAHDEYTVGRQAQVALSRPAAFKVRGACGRPSLGARAESLLYVVRLRELPCASVVRTLGRGWHVRARLRHQCGHQHSSSP